MEVEVVWFPKALAALDSVYRYIAQDSSENAVNFVDRLLDFGESLKILPNKYSICKHEGLSKRNLRCAIFEKKYFFIHKLVGHELRIYNLIHVSRHPSEFRI